MADARCQLECEDWVRLNFLAAKFGQRFHLGHIAVAHLVAVVLALAQNGELRRVPIIHDQGALPASHGGLIGVLLAGMSVVFLL